MNCLPRPDPRVCRNHESDVEDVGRHRVSGDSTTRAGVRHLHRHEYETDQHRTLVADARGFDPTPPASVRLPVTRVEPFRQQRLHHRIDIT